VESASRKKLTGERPLRQAEPTESGPYRLAWRIPFEESGRHVSAHEVLLCIEGAMGPVPRTNLGK
jgi:hypothetical protein